ncbi:Dos2-interacting transcription regulator of RNA-Pol-II family protein [Candida albicans]|uniref:MMS19 nucleotide excision repair protein n=1 Tax=Candida albicans TaxID=5476 RepID=A0A8H6C419_CANAX|nr:Dos2-interacting transcription regulator of RNA-Pol-II family protein [Candida albicans]
MSEHNIPILINQYIAASSGMTKKRKSIECLSKTIISLSDSKLTKQDINVLIEFLLNKLIDNDQICLQYSLMGINSLICKKNFLGDTNIEKILQQLYKNYDPKKNLAKVRYETFQILLNLLNQFNQYLNSSSIQLSNLYIKTFIHIASGEKDPRNLLISFELNNKINANFQFDNKNNELHQQFITDLFDICFCYFPISFKPPSNDPYKITSEQLKLALRELLPLKNDTLKTIELCIKNYSKNDATVIEEYWMTIWNALKFEILHNDISSNFNPTNNTIVASDYDEIDDNDEFKPLVLTLVILNRLISTLSQPEIMLHTVVEELKPNLEVMKEKSIKSSLILSSLGSTSVDNLNYIVDFLFQYQIWGKFLNIDKKEENEEQQEFDTNEDVSLNIAKQRDLIDSIGFVLTAYQVLKPTAHCHLLDYKDYILIFLGQLLTITSNLEKTLKCKIIQQLIKLIKLPGYLNTNELELILGNYFKQFFLDTTKTSGKKDVILQEIINGLIEVSQDSQITSLTIEFIINPILNQLLTTEDNDGGDINIETFQFQLEIVGDLCINYQILEVISIRLLNKLPIINNQSNNNLQLYKIIINLFIELIKKIESIQQFLTNSWYKNFIPKFMENLLIVLPLENILHNNDDNYELFEIVGDLLGLIIKFIDVSKHQEILDQLNQTFITNNNDDDDDEETNHQGPFKYPSNLLIEPNNYINVYNKILSSIDKTCVFKQDVDQQVIESIINLIYKIGNDDEYLRLQYLQTLCLLINKFTNNADFIESKLKFLEKVEEQDFPITKKILYHLKFLYGY